LSNDFYNATGNPAVAAAGLSVAMRTEFANIAAGFAKLPALSGNAGKLVSINLGGTGLAATNTITTTGPVALLGGFNAIGGTKANADGSAQIGALSITSDGTTVTISADAGHIFSFVVSAGGGGYTNGDFLYDPVSGSKFTATVVAGAVTALAMTVTGYREGVFPNPVSLIGGTGAGCQIHVTGSLSIQNLLLSWANGLYLDPLVNAANDAAAASAGVQIGQVYRNGSALMQRQS
jgi:hypothetical protein